MGPPSPRLRPLAGKKPQVEGAKGVFQPLRRLRCPLTRCAAQAVNSPPRQILRERRDILLRNHAHEIGHAGIVAAGAVAEVEH